MFIAEKELLSKTDPVKANIYPLNIRHQADKVEMQTEKKRERQKLQV